MTVYAVLLKAVNVGGAGNLPVATLLGPHTVIGVAEARTCIAYDNTIVPRESPEHGAGRTRNTSYTHVLARSAKKEDDHV